MKMKIFKTELLRTLTHTHAHTMLGFDVEYTHKKLFFFISMKQKKIRKRLMITIVERNESRNTHTRL